MKLKVFTLSFSDAARGFNDGAVEEFLAAREVIEVTDHFFVHERTPCLALVVCYRDVESDEKQGSAGTKKRGRRPDPREELDENEKAVYDALRTWRTARAGQDGVPPYVVANNRQLAGMVRLRAATRSALLKVQGFGEEKARHYGDEILDVLRRFAGTGRREPPEGEPT